MTDTTQADTSPSGAGAPVRAGSGRVCAEDGCGTRLSTYNDGVHCALHAPMAVPRTRAAREA